MKFPTYKDEVYDVRGRSRDWHRWCTEAWEAGYRFISHYDTKISTIYRLDRNPKESKGGMFYTGLHSWTYNNLPTMDTLIDREETVTKLDKPRSKQDVYDRQSDPLNIFILNNWVKTCNAARAAGYQFIRDMAGVFRTEAGEEYNKICYYKDLPERHVEIMSETKVVDTIETKVLEFLNDPKRSDRNALYVALAQKDFFGSTEDHQRSILKNLLDSDRFCKEGKQRFRNHMGDLLDEPDPYPELKGRGTVTLAYAGSPDDDIDQVKVIARMVNVALKNHGYAPRIIVEDK